MIKNSPYNLYGVYTSIQEIENFKKDRFITVPIMDLDYLNKIKEDEKRSSIIYIIFFHLENPQDCEIKLKETKDPRFKYPEIWIKSNLRPKCENKFFLDCNEEFNQIAVLQSLIKHGNEFNSILVECIIKMFEEFKPRYDTFLMAQKARNYLVEHPTDTLDQFLEKNKDSMQWLRKN